MAVILQTHNRKILLIYLYIVHVSFIYWPLCMPQGSE